MPKPIQSVVLIPNLSGEVFDVVGTSRTENYSIASLAGLSSPVATDWASSPDADVPLQNIATTSNIKALTTVYQGIPDAVAKIARNISTFQGPTAPNIVPTYATRWVALHQDNATKFIRMSDNAEFDAATLDPTNAATWNAWKARFKGQFDFSGRPVGALEDNINTIKVFKLSIGGSTEFTGFSPIMVHTAEILRNNLGESLNNVVYYTKDTTSAGNRFNRRGSKLFCRVEIDNYTIEYELCSSPSPIRAIEHVWVFGGQQYIIALTDAGYYTFVSAPYSGAIQESARADFAAQSVVYSQVVQQYNDWTVESARADFAAQSVSYISVVVTYLDWTVESARADFLAQSVSYELVVVLYDDWDVESAEAEFEPVFLDYIYSPTAPTVPPAHKPTDISEGVDSTISATALSYA